VVYDLNVQAARLARVACDRATARTPDRPRFVAGALVRPTDALDLARRERRDAPQRHLRRGAGRLRDQVRGLLDGGVDLLLVETIFDTLNAKAALFAIADELERRGARVPIVISAPSPTGAGARSPDRRSTPSMPRSRTRSRSPSAFNCALGAAEMRPYLATSPPSRRASSAAIRTRPPNAFGG